MRKFGARRESALGPQGLQHCPGMHSLQIPSEDRLYLSWVQSRFSSRAEPEEDAGTGAAKGMEVSNMHAHTLPIVWERALCSYSFGLALQSHNYFMSFRRYGASEICISLREPLTS